MSAAVAPSPAPPPPAARITRALTVACLLALVALDLAWEIWLAPLRPGGSWWALKVLPLLPLLPGLLRFRMHSYRALALLVWLYFTEGVVRAASDRPPASLLAALQIALALLLFAACTAHVRLRLRQSAAHAATSEDS